MWCQLIDGFQHSPVEVYTILVFPTTGVFWSEHILYCVFSGTSWLEGLKAGCAVPPGHFAHPEVLEDADLARRKGKGRGCYSDGNGGNGEYHVNNCLVVYCQE